MLHIFGAKSTDFKVDLAGSFRAHWCVRIHGILLDGVVTELFAKAELCLSTCCAWPPFAFWWQSFREECSSSVVRDKTPLNQSLLAIAWRQDLLLLLDECLLLHPALVLLVHHHRLLLLENHLLSLRWCGLCALRPKSVTLHLITIHLHIVLNLLPLEPSPNHACVTCIHVLSVYVLVLLLVEVKPLT